MTERTTTTMANSKKTNHEGESQDALPPELSTAIAEAEEVLRKYDPLRYTWKDTAHSIPEALAEERRLYLSAEADAQLGIVRAKRLDAARRRTIAAEALVELADELAKARDAVREAQAAFAQSVVAEFSQRWQQACSTLVRLQREAKMLGDILRVTVATPSPYVVSTNVVSQHPEVHLVADRIAAEAPPAALAPLIEILDRLDSANRLVFALQRGREMNERHHALSRARSGMPSEMSGTFEVRKAFDLHDVQYPAGSLVDRTVLTDNDLYRLSLGRNILRADVEAAVA